MDAIKRYTVILTEDEYNPKCTICGEPLGEEPHKGWGPLMYGRQIGEAHTLCADEARRLFTYRQPPFHYMIVSSDNYTKHGIQDFTHEWMASGNTEYHAKELIAIANAYFKLFYLTKRQGHHD